FGRVELSGIDDEMLQEIERPHRATAVRDERVDARLIRHPGGRNLSCCLAMALLPADPLLTTRRGPAGECFIRQPGTRASLGIYGSGAARTRGHGGSLEHSDAG